MALDGIMLHGIANELNTDISGARIEKIMQPDRDTLIMALHTNSGNMKLIACINAASARIHTTNISLKNPESPPMFCMLLRKHLTSGRIKSVFQHDLERVIEIVTEVTDEMGDLVIRRLIVELMGKHSNIIFTNENGVIIDSIKRVSEDISRLREVLPGLSYSPPPSQSKVNILEMSADDIYNALSESSGFAQKLITKTFMGISQATAQELSYRAFGDTDKFIESDTDRKTLADTLKIFTDSVLNNQFLPHIMFDNEQNPKDIYPFRYSYTGYNQKAMPDFHTMLDSFYELREIQRRKDEAARDMRNKLTTLIDKHKRKLSAQNESLSDCIQADKFRIYGDCIMTGIYKLKKGMDKASLTDYSSGEPIELEVPLDITLSPSDNAQKYYRKYTKLKRSRDIISGQINETVEEINYLEGQLDNIDKCSDVIELDEVRNELARFGYVSKQNKKDKKVETSRPLHFVSRNGIDIYVGKNNTQNDILTASAIPDNTWLHVKDIHGSHVIIRKKGDVPPETLYDAAMLAAYYSKAKNSSNVPVDYTKRKYVKKPSGAKPGMVIYTDNKTIYITPDAEHIRKLKIEE